MRSWRKVILLLLLNIALSAFALYFFSYMRIIDYNQLVSLLRPNQLESATLSKLEDPFLLEKEELTKKWEALSIKESELSNVANTIASNVLTLENDQKSLQERHEAFVNEQALIALRDEEQNTYDIKITEVATQISGMPPQTAAEILDLQEDLQVVDIFKKMEQLAAANGQASTVPFLLTLLDRDKAARVQTLMLVEQ